MSRWIGGGEGDKRSMAQKSMDLQSLLTAAEMALASIIHIKAFDYRILLRVVKEEEDKERSLVRAGKKRMSLPKDEAQQDDGKPPILNGTDLTASPVDQSNMDVVEPLDILDFAQESRQFEDWTNPDIEEEQPRDEQVSSPSTLPVRQLPFGQAFADAFVPSDIVTDLYSVSKFVLSRLSKLWKGTLKAWSSGKVLPRWDSVPSEGYATLSEDGSTAQERPDAERKSGRNNGLVHSNSINSTRGLLRSGSETGYTTSWPPPQRQDSFYSDPFSSQPGQLDEDGFGSGWEWSLSPRLGADKGESGDGGYTDAQELVNLGPSSSPKE